MSKRIIHVSTMHPSTDTRIFRNECVSLVKSGYEVILCIPHAKEEFINGVKIIPLPKYRNFKERIFDAPRKAVEIAEAQNGDLYHFHDPELLFVMGALAKRGKRVVWDAHENYANTIYSFNSLKIKPLSYIGAKLFGIAEMWYAKYRFKGVVTITGVMAEKYIRRGIPTAVAGNFSNIEKIVGPKEDRPTQPMVFISSGMQFKERGIFEMVEALGLLPDENNVQIRFAGKFKSDEVPKALKARVSSEKSGLLDFRGPFTWEQLVIDEIPKAHVGFVLFDTSDPNNCNGLPNRFFECWSNCLPVITTEGTQVAKITRQENGGIVIPDNSPQSIAKAMATFLENYDLAVEMGQNGRKAVEREYSWGVALKNIEKLYEEILD